MVRLLHTLMLMVLAWGLAVCLPVIAQTPTAPACKSCDQRGTVPCSKHGKFLAAEAAERGVQHCSVAADCKACAGALVVDCKTCRNSAAETALAARQQLARDWLSRRRTEIDEVAGGDALLHLATAHFDLAFGIKPQMVGKEKLDTHALMHLYGDRLEALRKLFLETFALREDEQATRLQVYMFKSSRDQARIGPRVTGIGVSQSTGTKLMGVDCVYSMWQDPRYFPDDEALHRAVVHNVTHLLLCNATPSQVLYNRKNGWIDEGVAHWFEDRLTGKCLNYCFEEVLVDPGVHWKGGRWRAPVRKLVEEGRGRSFAELSGFNTDQLDFQDHALAFAYVDFLLSVHGGAKFRDLVRLAKQEKPMREALPAVYGFNLLTIEAPFQQWVKENYPAVESR
jgi:hypothetical protein